MTATEQARFQELYIRHLRALKLQGKRDKTIDSYARAVRRVSSHFDCCPDQLHKRSFAQHGEPLRRLWLPMMHKPIE